jgi:hypothetical protein
LWDGNSWKELRNRYNGKPAEIEKVAPAAKEKGERLVIQLMTIKTIVHFKGTMVFCLAKPGDQQHE